MAFKLIEFNCKKCDTKQEQIISNSEGLAEDPCKQCQAAKENLEQTIANGAYTKHGSWSNWRVV